MKTYHEMFTDLKMRKEAALMPFIVIGDPDFKTSLEIAKTLINNGADALEIGFPFSDPIADGATIQEADTRALKNGITVDKCFKFLRKLRKFTPIPIGLLVYYNLIYQRGVEKFYKDTMKAGVNSILIADLPPEEAEEALKASKKYNIDQIFIIAPTTSNKRLKMISKHASGFHYLVSVMGVTGARKEVKKSTLTFIKRVKENGKLPVMVGFGISKPSHIKEITKAGADGAIVGSAIIDIIAKNLDKREKILEEIARFTKKMKKATRRP
ncbi:MAG TPA: tryptophan synthase subunit alpha [Methanothermobacter sp.]|jgi:tryptophan synthase alpha chain|uniref:Tryptophan synthase alpha chain n=1 Tax=Methanothermobacter tenebrarum TaxID=680118 RepID=A0ABN6PDR4_9EURY|nr:tryptophan synthase subunit alpha [Methanothermobacter tenebrarum]MDD3455156.1 tryptophan synthase subunit alpha [Methanobacteriales archaeon]MDI6882099.1 tryptophan synthase subunit alpha [Methanothermobacter sp.]MDX9692833.1 tryptophan synthase subunit alpha [Methanothermobacter sp.]BDH80023.1 tryptophan synthase subunit alpha [Methanothermobacter tenebrarum]HHW16423.1 tryptophan synthase subunit alpha [Methanothermobacter sp.]